MKILVRWLFGLGIAALLTVVPYVHYRAQYVHGKRIREVCPGILYRSGQLTQEGFADVIDRFHIRTIINAQDDYPDPEIEKSYFDRRTVKESELCGQLGVRFVYLPPDVLDPRRVPPDRPAAVDRLLAILDDPANHPVLIHCRAGLHRTGCYTAIFRMEYEGWTPRQAIDELKANGFGEFVCSSANEYIMQYILSYQPGERRVWQDVAREQAGAEHGE
jgi:protein tyrosine/serine phosphatase